MALWHECLGKEMPYSRIEKPGGEHLEENQEITPNLVSLNLSVTHPSGNVK